MSVLSYTDIFPDQLTTDQIVDQQHTPVLDCQQDITLSENRDQLWVVKKRSFFHTQHSDELCNTGNSNLKGGILYGGRSIGYDRKVTMKAQLIITHPGSAHFDDVAAVSLILAVYADTEFRIERREPAPAELDNPDVWVVDIGDRHEPEKRNFDHHQDTDCPAAFVLVAEYLGLLETMSVMPLWHFKDEVDRFGPVNSSV